jgi:opacity protein-like surface antigen
MRLTLATAILACLFTLLPIASANADSGSMITAGIGSNLGVSNTTQLSGATATGFSQEFSVRMKAVYVLGLELAYSPTDSSHAGNGLVFSNDLRLSGLLYFVPTPVVSAYAKGGIEADNIVGLFSIDDLSNAYHLGGGLDIDITDNIVLGLEFLMLIPGKASVENAIESYATAEYASYEAALSAGQIPDQAGIETPGVSDFINPSNFRMTVGARYYF